MLKIKRLYLSFACIGLSMLLLISFTGPVWAVLGPLSEEELYEGSELIVEVTVLGVVLERVDRHDEGSGSNKETVETYHYCAWAIIDKTIKGMLQPHSTIQIIWRDERRRPMPGPLPDPAFLPGEKAKAYLKKASTNRGTWSTFHPMCKNGLADPTGGLPKEVGEFVLISPSE